MQINEFLYIYVAIFCGVLPVFFVAFFFPRDVIKSLAPDCEKGAAPLHQVWQVFLTVSSAMSCGADLC